MENILSKDEKEYEFLNLSYNRFLDLYYDLCSDQFDRLTKEVRLFKIKQVVCIYFELLNYEPIKEFLNIIKVKRPPMESKLSNEYLKFIRNILIHFPIFKKWDEIYITKTMVNWHSEGKSIDQFIKKYLNHPQVEYRYKNPKEDKFIYVSINFPQHYNDNNKIYLNDLVSEKDSIRLLCVFMYRVLMSQVIEIKER